MFSTVQVAYFFDELPKTVKILAHFLPRSQYGISHLVAHYGYFVQYATIGIGIQPQNRHPR
jgi:hypothetical protein